MAQQTEGWADFHLLDSQFDLVYLGVFFPLLLFLLPATKTPNHQSVVLLLLSPVGD